MLQHLSETAELILEPREQDANNYWTGKPAGLWYGVDNSWIDWCAENMSDWLVDKYLYEVVLNEPILKIDTLDWSEATHENF